MNNNNWIKINSIGDCPKIITVTSTGEVEGNHNWYNVCYFKEDEYVYDPFPKSASEVRVEFRRGEITHYKELVKPEAPVR